MTFRPFGFPTDRAMTRRWPILALILRLVVLDGLGQAVTLYTDWNRAQEALRCGDLAQYGAEQRRLEETLRALLEGR